MQVAVIAAMEEEVAILKNRIKNHEIKQILGIDFHIGTIANCQVVLLQSGIGKVAAALGTTILLTHFQVDVVINTGSAGGLSSKLKIGDIVVSTNVFYHDANLTAFGYKAGQMAGCPEVFDSATTYQKLAKKCIEHHDINAVLGSIASGDSFINSDAMLTQIKSTFPNAIAVDMEAASIGHICWRFSIPFVVVRAISDNGNEESNQDFKSFLALASAQSSLIVESMLSKLA